MEASRSDVEGHSDDDDHDRPRYPLAEMSLITAECQPRFALELNDTHALLCSVCMSKEEEIASGLRTCESAQRSRGSISAQRLAKVKATQLE